MYTKLCSNPVQGIKRYTIFQIQIHMRRDRGLINRKFKKKNEMNIRQIPHCC